MDPDVSVALEGALAEIEAADTPGALEAVRIKYLGRKNGIIPGLFSSIKSLPPDRRKARGQALQHANPRIDAAMQAAKDRIGAAAAPALPTLDVTLPGSFPGRGRIHPLNVTTQRLVDIFASLGFDVAEGPEVEREWYNFDALNIPPDHPAREDYQSFYLGHERALRSQTSSVQIRVMETRKPPLRVIAPGRVYRPDKIDATHHSTFHQIEGLWVDENVTFADLKGVLGLFMRRLLGPETKIRFRPSFFPFTEPSAEVDVFWSVSGDPDEAEWIEMGGCGMVDPNVFEAVKIDPERYTGFAFGFGIERLTMQSRRIDDIRLFLENDLRFLEQFRA